MSCPRVVSTFLAALTFLLSASPGSAQTYGDIVLDGNLAEWSEIDRLDILPEVAPAGTRVYAKFAAGHVVFGMSSPTLSAGTIGTVWVNTDENLSTGYQVYGSTTGAEYNVTFSYPAAPSLYRNGRGETLAVGSLPFAVGAGTIEFAVPYSALENAGAAVQARVSLDGTEDVFIPSNFFSDREFSVPGSSRPARVARGKRVGVVYSATTAAKFFDLKAYSQLFMAAQHQVMMAGLPYDTLSEDDLTDLSRVIQYDALVIPAFNFVPRAKLLAIERALTEAVNRYRVGIVTSNDFLTNDETGAALLPDPYKRQKEILGVYPTTAFSGPQPVAFRATNVTHPSMPGYTTGEVVKSYGQFFTRVFDTAPGRTTTRVVDQQIGAAAYGGVLLNEAAGRTAHFATERLFGDTNLGWSVLRWVVYGNQPSVGLKLSRQESAFFSRTDMDQSKFPEDFEACTVGLYNIFREWKERYGFVGTSYLNIGNNPPAETTNWAEARPVYLSYRNLGFELGSHSYSHPDFTSQLSPAQIQFEFQAARGVFEQQLGLLFPGAAVPGNPEPLATSLSIGQYHSYTSGTYSGSGAGYPGAFGYMQPEPSVFYFSPNMTPDFTIIEFRKQTAAQAETLWRQELEEINRHASTPIVHWPWHDYGPTRRFNTGYTREMFENTIRLARDSGAEFMTGLDLYGRVQALLASSVEVAAGQAVTVTVTSSDAGRFALEVRDPMNPSRVIERVGNWYAFNGNRIFLPRDGGTFAATFGTAPAKVTRITSLPMRSTLVSASGDGERLTFSVKADGKATLALNPPPGGGFVITGASSSTITGDTAEVTFDTYGAYTVNVTPYRCGDGVVTGGVEACDDGNGAGGDGCNNSCQVEAGFACTGSPSVCTRAAEVTEAFTSIGAEDGWVLQYYQGYDVGGFIGASGAGALGLRLGDDQSKRAYRGILSFDTSSIPDGATVLGVTLELTRGGVSGKNPFNSMSPGVVDIRSGFFGYSNALETYDYQALPTASAVGTLTTGPSGSAMSVPLSAPANGAVNRAGRTQVKLRFNRLTNGDRATDIFGFYTGEATNASFRPKLKVRYRP